MTLIHLNGHTLQFAFTLDVVSLLFQKTAKSRTEMRRQREAEVNHGAHGRRNNSGLLA